MLSQIVQIQHLASGLCLGFNATAYAPELTFAKCSDATHYQLTTVDGNLYSIAPPNMPNNCVKPYMPLRARLTPNKDPKDSDFDEFWGSCPDYVWELSPNNDGSHSIVFDDSSLPADRPLTDNFGSLPGCLDSDPQDPLVFLNICDNKKSTQKFNVAPFKIF
ncbi:hypothetical protein HDV06_004043 [Boothiomyces sp. JEL0866]|nr:hypothetical protein HDV06_004043 [Boothiomyces sp. JEL0866]